MVINIHPENSKFAKGISVHKNILIKENEFKLKKNVVDFDKKHQEYYISNNINR